MGKSGSALGNEFWMRNVLPSIDHESMEQFYSRTLFRIVRIERFSPVTLQTAVGFFFLPTLRAHRDGRRTAHIRSLFEKPREEDLLVHLHEHCGDLGNEFSTAPMEVLWSPGARTRVDLANDYEAVRELVHETLHAQIGMRRERVTTFGHIEEWSSADLERYRKLGLPKLLEAGAKTICLANILRT
jgi:hypothetical protein